MATPCDTRALLSLPTTTVYISTWIFRMWNYATHVKVRQSNSRQDAPPQPSPILRKINFLIWDRIWPALGYFQAIGVLGMRFWALFGVSDFYLFRQVWSLTNPWPCSNLGFPRSIFFFFAPKHPLWRVERRYAKKGGVLPVCTFIPGPWHGQLGE